MADLKFKQTSISRGRLAYTIFPLHVYSQYRSEKSFHMPHHWHEEIEILYFETGEFNLEINGDLYYAKAGEIYFVNSQELHEITAITSSSIHHAIVFRPKILQFEWYETSAQKYLNPLLNGNIRFAVNVNDKVEVSSFLKREFEDALKSYHKRDDSWPITVKSAVLKMIAELAANGMLIDVDPVEVETKDLLFAEKLMMYIHNNYMFKITLDRLSELVNLNTNYFCKTFKETFGKTAIEYINEYRIEKACQLLIQSDDKIIEIAFLVGFESFSYFIRKFKTLKGMTPSTYRRENSM